MYPAAGSSRSLGKGSVIVGRLLPEQVGPVPPGAAGGMGHLKGAVCPDVMKVK